ncbi:cysteine/glutathione ABC transporter membrane /ATP-binding component [Citrobacter koseri]|nr:cysteine/glutathione ABC transporter membrane /ATP-binding component [Citrobacter koseri]
MLPAAGVRGAAITRTAGRYFERLVSHDATFRVLQHLRIHTFSKLLPLSPAGLARYRQGELLNRVVADVRPRWITSTLRVISPLVGAFVVIMVVTLGLSVLDFTLAITLGGIMLLTLFIMPPLFYRAGKSHRAELNPFTRSVSPAVNRLATGSGGTDYIWRQLALSGANGSHGITVA